MTPGGNNFPGLSRTKVIFQDFPGPGILKKKNPGLSRCGNPNILTKCDLQCESKKSPEALTLFRKSWEFLIQILYAFLYIAI